MSKNIGTEDQRHEIDHLKYCTTLNKSNNTTILVPGSIIVYNSDNPDKMVCEFDGLAIYPTQKENQILFLESKNMHETGKANHCLCRKFEQLKLPYDKKQIHYHGQDVYMYASI